VPVIKYFGKNEYIKKGLCLPAFMYVSFQRTLILMKFEIGICSKICHRNFILVSAVLLFGGILLELILSICYFQFFMYIRPANVYELLGQYCLIFDGVENY
jgi:hypothetical protein